MSSSSSSTKGAIQVPAATERMLKQLTNQITTDAEKIVRQDWPEKILRLHKLLECDEFQELNKDQVAKEAGLPDLAEWHCQQQQDNNDAMATTGNRESKTQAGAKRRRTESHHDDDEAESVKTPWGAVDWSKREGGKDGRGPVIPANKRIIAMMDMLRNEVKNAVGAIGTVKLWVQLLVPKIEDGNNFGVEVQEEIISELSRIEDASFQVLETLSKYFDTRSRLVEKYIKHPTVSDYRQAILEHDEMEILNLRMCALDLRNNYTVLHDMLTKNLDRIKKPRGSSNALEHMY